MCCGQKRAQLHSTLPANPQMSPMPETAASPPRAPVPVIFEYLGTTALSVIGPVTRRLYRFDAPHARVAVDPRDAPSIAAVPNLAHAR